MSELISKYLSLVKGEYAGLNLTRILTDEDFKNKQWLDSLAPLDKVNCLREDIQKAEVVIDVGFGGGFPLLPLAEVFHAKQFIGFEARSKKAKAVQDIANKLGLTNVSTYHHRLEDILIDKQATIFLKAVGKVNDFLSKINATCPIRVYFYKGPGFDEQESKQLTDALKTWNIIADIQYDLFENSRRIIGFEPKNVPRGTKSTKNLVKVSSIL